MKVQSLKLVCFSPTGTTKEIIKSIACGINHSNVELIDITKPNARKQQLQTFENELLVVAVPVYMGRVPSLFSEWLQLVQACNTPSVCIVVYGNRAYGDALLELKNTMIERGCKPIACSAFIGEHSFSSAEAPIAKGRPDARDFIQAELFGHKINEKLQSISSIDLISDINIPGNYPYDGSTKVWDIDFIKVSDDCLQCGICAERCPMGAVDIENSSLIDIEKCITCCACIKSCPQSARTMKPSPVKEWGIRLNNLFKERKEPEIFL
ncbi:MAG: EFR1 family ferrodoxin [Solirubrobacterales bacterium]